jgi:hypothetical protein
MKTGSCCKRYDRAVNQEGKALSIFEALTFNLPHPPFFPTSPLPPLPPHPPRMVHSLSVMHTPPSAWPRHHTLLDMPSLNLPSRMRTLSVSASQSQLLRRHLASSPLTLMQPHSLGCMGHTLCVQTECMLHGEFFLDFPLLQAHNPSHLHPRGFGHTSHASSSPPHPSPSRTYRPRTLAPV